MNLERKLKPDRDLNGALLPFAMILIFGLATLFFGIKTGLVFLSGFFWFYAVIYLYSFLRTRNLPQLALVSECLFFGAMFFFFEPTFGSAPAEKNAFRLAYTSGVIFFGFLIIALFLTRRLKWRGREVFELVGAPVEETGDGYTSRPRPVGKVEYSLHQVTAFSRFCARHLIALPYYSSQGITLVPVKMGNEFFRILGLSGDYLDASWVNFSMDGQVSVHISQKDYLDYRQSLAFDQLCQSFGQLFISWIELHARGEGIRIMDQLDDLNLSLLS